jgi:hypothetical protein
VNSCTEFNAYISSGTPRSYFSYRPSYAFPAPILANNPNSHSDSDDLQRHGQRIWNSQCQLPKFSENLLVEGTRLGRNCQCYEIPSDDPHSVGNRSEMPIASFIQLHDSHGILRMVHVRVQNTYHSTQTPQFSIPSPSWWP